MAGPRAGAATTMGDGDVVEEAGCGGAAQREGELSGVL
jgi:hypothetical protein